MMLIFHFITYCRQQYIVYVAVHQGQVLRIEIEEPETVDRWSGEFSSQCKYI